LSILLFEGVDSIEIVSSALDGRSQLSYDCHKVLSQLLANHTDPDVLQCEFYINYVVIQCSFLP